MKLNEHIALVYVNGIGGIVVYFHSAGEVLLRHTKYSNSLLVDNYIHATFLI